MSTLWHPVVVKSHPFAGNAPSHTKPWQDVPWDRAVDRDLVQYHCVVHALRRSLRNLFEMLLVASFLKRRARPPPHMFSRMPQRLREREDLAQVIPIETFDKLVSVLNEFFDDIETGPAEG